PRNSSSATSAAVSPRDQVPVPERAALRDPTLGRIVDVDDPEPLVISPFPLEVVEQRPDVIAANVDAMLARPLDRCDVLTEVFEPPLVLDDPVVEPVLESGPVLRDQQWQIAVVALEPQQ